MSNRSGRKDSQWSGCEMRVAQKSYVAALCVANGEFTVAAVRRSAVQQQQKEEERRVRR